MIWESTALTTIADVVILVVTVAAVRMLLKQRRVLVAGAVVLGPALLTFGLALVGLFYLTDLFVMWGLPLLIASSPGVPSCWPPCGRWFG